MVSQSWTARYVCDLCCGGHKLGSSDLYEIIIALDLRDETNLRFAPWTAHN